MKSQRESTSAFDDLPSVSSQRRYSSRVKPNGDFAQCVTAIAQPCIISAWSPLKKQSQSKLSGMGSSMRQMRVDDSPEFRITKGSGVKTDSYRQTAMLNSKCSSQERLPLVLTSTSKQAALRTDSCSAFDRSLAQGMNSERVSPKNLVEISKMRKMNEARR